MWSFVRRQFCIVSDSYFGHSSIFVEYVVYKIGHISDSSMKLDIKPTNPQAYFNQFQLICHMPVDRGGMQQHFSVFCASQYMSHDFGEVTERLNVPVLKTGVGL